MQKDQHKIRIYELARELDMESKALIDLCKQAGIELRNQLSSVDADVRDQIVALVTRGGSSQPASARSPVPVPDPDKKIRNLAGPRPRTERPETPTDPVPTPPVTPTPAVETPTESTNIVVSTAAPVKPKPEATRRPVETTAREVELEPTSPEKPEAAEVASTVEAAPVVAETQAVEKPTVEATETPAEKAAEEKEAEKPAPTPTQPTPVPPAPRTEKPAPTPVPPRPASITPVNRGQMRDLNARPQQNTPRPPQTPGQRPATQTPATETPSQGQTPGQGTSAQGTPGQGGARPVTPQRPGGGSPGTGSGRFLGNQGSRSGTQGGRPGAGPGQQGQRPGQGGGTQQGGRPGQQNRRPGEQQPAEQKGPKKITNLTTDMLGGRSSISIEELRRKQREQQQGGNQPPVVGQQSASAGGDPVPDVPDMDDERGGKKGGGHVKGQNAPAGAPGVAGRDQRHKDRQRRRDEGGVAVRAGRLVEEEETGRRRHGHKPRHKEKIPVTVARKGKVPISLPITVRSLSEAIGMRSGEVLLKLMQFGVAGININSILDPELAETIALEKNCELEIKRELDAEQRLAATDEQEDRPEDLEPRAPVVTIMGHVDHGKTTLLDKIRVSNVAGAEIGGITQVIRAWRVEHGGRPITFLDTPGHEAFTKMRARGANVTDIAIIVVAVNDGVMPQTEEAIAHAKAAGVSIIVALNKVDLPDANIKKTEQQLYGLSLIPDTMGGDVQFVQVSGKTGKGIDELLDTISLVAEVKELKANPKKDARGSCLEAHLDPDEGVFATLLVREGTLRKGDTIVCGGAFGRVRAMYNDLGRSIQEAGPTVPVRITGLDEVPNADDPFAVVKDVVEAREIAESRRTRTQEAAMTRRPTLSLENLGEAKVTELKVILKAEARGSIEAIKAELEKLQHDEVRVRLLHSAIGGINESDVQLALTSPEDTIILGFNVIADDRAKTLADERGIQVRLYNIIYQLTDDIKSALEGKLKPREEIIFLGRAVVRETFKISRVGTIAGCYVTKGLIERNAKVRVIRNGVVIYPPAERSAGLDSLKRFKEDAREVKEGNECGIKVAGYDDIKVDDIIEAYRIDQVMRTLN